jgi:hypothetical protein
MVDLVNKYAFDKPIAGESLVDSPTKSRPWERPPEFVKVDEATKWLFDAISNKDTLAGILDQIREGVALDSLAQTIGLMGVTNGKWTPDLMLLLLEPIIYMLYFMATQAGINPIISSDEDTDLSPEEEQEALIQQYKSKVPSGIMSRG